MAQWIQHQPGKLRSRVQILFKAAQLFSLKLADYLECTVLCSCTTLGMWTHSQHCSVADAVPDGCYVPVGHSHPHLQPGNEGAGVPVTEVEPSLEHCG